jgi:glutathione S-transferase
MIKLYDSAFSPFARKVRMVLEHKGLAHEAIDGLLKSNHAALKAVNGRIEVPVLVDGDIVVVNSPDIVAYVDHRYPDQPVLPEEPAARVHARAWERLSDTFVDPIFVDISYWKWAERPDQMPQGLLDAARADLRAVYAALEHELADRDFISGTLSVADIALLPHLAKRQGDGDGIFRCPGRGRPCSVARRTMRTRRSAHTPDTEPPSPLVRV